MPDIEPSFRRDRKPTLVGGLVAAPPVRSARVDGSGGTRARGWLVGGGIAVALVVAISATVLATAGSADADLPTANAAQDLRAAERGEEGWVEACALPAAADAGGSVSKLDSCDDAVASSDDSLTATGDDAKSGLRPDPQASGQPRTPEDAISGAVLPNGQRPGTSKNPTKVSPTPGIPSTDPAPSPSTDPAPSTKPAPAPSTPSKPAPAPSTPSKPAPAPSTPAKPAPAPATPSKPAPAPVPAPKALAFTGITEKHVIGLLGIKILSSSTLSLSGEPGSKATVWYGLRKAGTVTFNSSGRTSITLNASLIGSGRGSTIVRAEYSDGTAGSSIEARRDSI